jgi:glycerol-3-phosphate acyltransferase PlsY
MIPNLLLVGIAYLIGSIPTGLWLGRIVADVDVRTVGSHRTGATNVQRALGTRAAIAVLVIDLLKGAVAVLLTRALTGNDYIAAVAGVAATAGHIWPVFAGFRGGRGVSTAGGAVMALAPVALFCTLAVIIVVVVVTRFVSLGSIVGALMGTIWVVVLRGRAPESDAAILLAFLVGTLVLFRHADNLHRLLHGVESKLGASRVSATPEGP